VSPPIETCNVSYLQTLIPNPLKYWKKSIVFEHLLYSSAPQPATNGYKSTKSASFNALDVGRQMGWIASNVRATKVSIEVS